MEKIDTITTMESQKGAMDMKQLIISVGREYGSGGHVIAEKLAEKLGLRLYDSNLLTCVAKEKHVSPEELKAYDEMGKNKLLYRTVNGFSNSPEENLANLQFDYLRKLAAAGESFVIVGRCAETALSGIPGLISLFILGDEDAKIQRIRSLHPELSRDEAKRLCSKEDWKRKSYHNYYCKGKWGDARTYDLTINSSRLGLDGTADALEAYIRARIASEMK